MGWVYLLHLAKPLSPDHTSRHYLGFVEDDIERRIRQHRAGTGARFLEVAKERNITFSVVRIWQGSRTLERKLKNRKNAPALCPLCQTTGCDVNFYR